MLYVPDANVAIKWFFNEEFSDKARLLMAHLIDGREQVTASDLLRRGAVVVSADAGLVANGSQLGRTLHVREYGEAPADQP